MSEPLKTDKIALDKNTDTKALASRLGMQPRKRTPLWIWLDTDRDVYCVEYPELQPGGNPVRAESVDVSDAITHAAKLFHATLLTAIQAKQPVPWGKAKGEAPEGATVKILGCAY